MDRSLAVGKRFFVCSTRACLVLGWNASARNPLDGPSPPESLSGSRAWMLEKENPSKTQNALHSQPSCLFSPFCRRMSVIFT